MASYGFWFLDCSAHLPVRNRPGLSEESQRFGDNSVYPIRQQHNTIDLSEWQSVPQPPALKGQPWPPRSVEHLCKEFDLNQTPCLDCKMYTPCSCYIDQWRLYNNCIFTSLLCQNHISNLILCQPHDSKTWIERPILYIQNIYIRRIPHPSLFTWQHLRRGQIIGEITGQIRPADLLDDAHPEDQPDVWPWFLGSRDWANSHPEIPDDAVIDSTKAGSLMKFLNHSCSENCTLFWGRVGNTRGLFVKTLMDILPRTELTIWDQRRTQRLDVCCQSRICQCALRIRRNDSVVTLTDPAEEERMVHEAEARGEAEVQRRLREAEEQRLAHVAALEASFIQQAQQSLFSGGQQLVPPEGQQFMFPRRQEFVSPEGQQFTFPTGQQLVSPGMEELIVPGMDEFNIPSYPVSGVLPEYGPLPPDPFEGYELQSTYGTDEWAWSTNGGDFSH